MITDTWSPMLRNVISTFGGTICHSLLSAFSGSEPPLLTTTSTTSNLVVDRLNHHVRATAVTATTIVMPIASVDFIRLEGL